MSPQAAIRNLVVSYAVGGRKTYALDGVSLTVNPGDSIGIVGESGSGKSTLGLAIGRLLDPNAVYEEGEIDVNGVSVLQCAGQELRALRRNQLGFVFQNPMGALDPTMRVGKQLALAVGGQPSAATIHRLFSEAGLENPVTVAASFPHQLSGGMAQRAVIAMAIARGPAVLIADEPTASLDASIKSVILDLLMTVGKARGSSVLILSHDLRAVARRCASIAVMYGGRVVETGLSQEVFSKPRHPYTQALVRAAAGNEGPGGRLESIPGVPVVLHQRSNNCAFAGRCAFTQPICTTQRPDAVEVEGRQVACHFAAGGLTRTAALEISR